MIPGTPLPNIAFLIVRFVNGSDFVSEAIDYVTNSLWDHVELAQSDGSLDPAKITAWIGAHAGTGVQARPVDYCKPTRERRYAIPMLPVAFRRIQHSALAAVGKTPYDYLDIAGLLVKDRALHTDHRAICSQFTINEIQFKGGEVMLNVNQEYSYLVTPETLHLSPRLVTNGARCVYEFPESNSREEAKLQN